MEENQGLSEGNNKKDSAELVKELAEKIKSKSANNDEIKQLLLALKDQEECITEYKMDDSNSSILHTALTHRVHLDIVEALIKTAPELMLQERSKEYKGQTPFHMAIVQNKIGLVKLMLEHTTKTVNIKKSELLKKQATGSKFKNNLMMGQFPLFVAVLSFNYDIVSLLLEMKADIFAKTDKGDTVFHLLIKYAAIFTEKTIKTVKMFDYLKNHLDQMAPPLTNLDENNAFQYTNQFVGVWFEKNNENLTALQLAAKHRIPELIECIYSLKDVYYFENEADGLTDVKTFDITEFDSEYHYASQKKSETVSISEMLSHGHHNINSVFRIITRTPFKQVVESKWSVYRKIFRLLMFLHFSGIVLCTVFAVLRREHSAVSIVASILIGMLGITYIIIAFFVIRRKKQRYDLMKSRKVILHHFGYICLLVTCSVSLLIDLVLNNIPGIKTDVPIIIALVSGWWLSVFFLSPYRRFSFFTVMIRRVFFGDFLRFSIIMAFELVSFTAAMYLLFLPPDYTTSNVPVEDFGGYFQTMLTMFKLMIGLGDIEILYDAKIPSLAIVIFVIFVITTYVLMVNALIAMMSNTCTQVFQEKYPEWRIQQLSAILVIEDITKCMEYFGIKVSKMNAVERKMVYMQFNNTEPIHVPHTRFFITITWSELDEASDEYRYIMEREKRMRLEELLLSWFSSQQISVESQATCNAQQRQISEETDVTRQQQNMVGDNTSNGDSSSSRPMVIHVRAASSQQNNKNRRNAVYEPPTVEI